jgi:hypothetical protein
MKSQLLRNVSVPTPEFSTLVFMAAPPRTAYGFIGNTFSNWVQFIRTSPLASVFAELVGDPRSLAVLGSRTSCSPPA